MGRHAAGVAMFDWLLKRAAILALWVDRVLLDLSSTLATEADRSTDLTILGRLVGPAKPLLQLDQLEA